MSRSNGKYAQFISDRSGMAFPYKEMVVEWNGSRVHVSEFEPKQPQLEPKPTVADPQGLQFARPARVEPETESLLPSNPFNFTSGSSIVTVTEPNHQRSTGDIVVFDTLPLESILPSIIVKPFALLISVTPLKDGTARYPLALVGPLNRTTLPVDRS